MSKEETLGILFFFFFFSLAGRVERRLISSVLTFYRFAHSSLGRQRKRGSQERNWQFAEIHHLKMAMRMFLSFEMMGGHLRIASPLF